MFFNYTNIKNKKMTEKNLRLNNISSRQFILSPAVSNGADRESSSKDFYQCSKNILYLGCLGAGIKVKHCQTEVPYTIVNFEKEKISKLNFREKINSTLELMYKSTHPYMFRLLNNYETEEKIGLIFESFDGDSLDNLIQKGKCDIQTSLKYFVEILLAINHMNNLGLYNLNIRPENILIDECAKITDYGLKMTGKAEIPKRIKDMVTIGNRNLVIDVYFSPEEINSILNPKEKINLNSKLDSWKCGILLYEMLTNFKSPFSVNNNNDNSYISFENELINAIMKEEINLSIINDDFCRDLIGKLLKKNPNERIDIKDVLNIDYIKSINIDQKEINLTDNIINPEEDGEENEQSEEENDNDDDKDDKDEVIKKLVSENEILKKRLSSEKESNKFEPLISDKNNEIKNEIENKKEDNFINDNDKDKLEENNIDKSIDLSFSEEDDDILEEKSISNDNNESIFNKYKTLKEKYLKIKYKNKLLKKELKYYKEETSNMRRKNLEILEQKTLNFLNNFEKLDTSKISNISELSDLVLNSVNIFRESQNNLQKLIEKLITISDDRHKSLLDESKRYIDNKGKTFFETLEKLSEEKNKKDLNEVNKQERKQECINKENEINELKKQYELSKQRENLLKEKIKALQDKVNATDDFNKNLMVTVEELYSRFNINTSINKKK